MAVVVEDVLAQVQAMLALPDDVTLPARWKIIAGKALADAYRDVYGVLAGRDLLVPQIDSWTGLDSAVLSLSLFWSMAQGGPMQGGVPQEDIDRLDLREWLRTAVLTDSSGAIIKPDPSTGLVGFGSIAGGWDDAKKREYDPRRLGFTDPRTGRLRRW